MATPFLLAAKCDGDRPSWTAKFWAGDSASSSIVRGQDSLAIHASDPLFDNFVCMTYEDIEKLEIEVLSKCEKWSGRVRYSMPDAFNQ